LKLIQAFRTGSAYLTPRVNKMMQQERESIVFITTAEVAIGRFRQASEFLQLDSVFAASLQYFLDDDKIRPRTLLLDMRVLAQSDQALLPKLRQLLPKTQVVGVVEKIEDQKNEWVLQHFMTTEMMNSFTLEFMLFQRNFCEFFEISPSDLFPDTMVYFNAYHFLPLNMKYLPLVHENFKLTERKHKRIETLKSLYIFRGDSSAYVQYIEKYFDQFGVGLRKRAKSRTYQLLVEWRDLLYAYLLERRPIESTSIVRPDYMLWLNELLNYLTTSGDIWGLIFDLCHLECFAFDRSMLEMLIGCLLSRNLGDDLLEKIVDLRLLHSLTRFRVDSLIFKKWLLSEDLSPEEQQKWALFPNTLKDFKFAPDFPPETVADMQTYQKQFLAKTDKNLTAGHLVYSYTGEQIAAVMQKAPADQFKKDEIVETIIVKLKEDGILTEAWVEEIRQFLKK
jgi:hypothetical protein